MVRTGYSQCWYTVISGKGGGSKDWITVDVVTLSRVEVVRTGS